MKNLARLLVAVTVVFISSISFTSCTDINEENEKIEILTESQSVDPKKVKPPTNG